MTRFRQALLDELMTRVVDPIAPPAPAPRRVTRRLVLATTGGVAALAAAVSFVATPDRATPAYALTPNDDGTVTIAFNDIADPAAVNRALRDVGVRARVMLPVPDDACPSAGRGVLAPAGVAQAFRLQERLGRADGKRINVARLRPEDIQAGTVLVFVPMQQGPSDRFGPDVMVYRFEEPGPDCVVNLVWSPRTPEIPEASRRAGPSIAPAPSGSPGAPSTADPSAAPVPDASNAAEPTATPR